MKAAYYDQDGYTLLELLVVISILVMSYLLVTPLMIGKSGNVQLNRAAQQIASDLRSLRTRAVTGGKVLQFEIAEDGHGYRYSGVERMVALEQDMVLISRAENAYGNQISFYPDGTNSGIDLVLKSDNRELSISSEWPKGQVEVRHAG